MSNIREAFGDIQKSLKQISLGVLLGWNDIRQRYKRSKLGQIWLTISTAVMICTISFVFSTLFHQKPSDYLPYLATGLIFWNFISNSLVEGCEIFIDASSLIKQLPIPLFTYVIRLVVRNLVVLAHNLVLLPFFFLYAGHELTTSSLLVVAGLLLLIANISFFALIFGVISTKFRDLPPIFGSVMQVVFYGTPVMWHLSMLEHRAGAGLLKANPIFHWIEIVRGPLMGNQIEWTSWAFSVATAVFSGILAIIVFGKSRWRIPFWL